MVRTFVKIAASFFYVGYLPIAPGAWGSLAAFLIIVPCYSTLVYWTLALSILGLFICRPSQDVFGQSDPHAFVLDEVCGMCLSVLFLPPTLAVWITGYVIFRILDTWKPWPIILIQRHPNAMSIMWDDLAAGALTNVILQVALRILK